MAHLNFDTRPILVFWESTRACLLACRHCRAEAMQDPAPGELTHAEGLRFIDSLTQFGRPYPVLIMTGGDVLMRTDVFDLVDHARQLGIPVGLAPSVTPKLTEEAIARICELGVKTVSISLDGASPAVHEGIRGIPGHFQQTIAALRQLVSAGITVQVNTVVMQENIHEFPAIVQILKEVGVKIWEVFFLVSVGRGKSIQELGPAEYEDAAHFLYDASRYNLIVRTVEGPFFRRVAAWRRGESSGDAASAPRAVAEKFRLGSLYLTLAEELRARLGAPFSESQSQTSGTRDGKGIVFVAHDGTVFPAGFLPVPLGNIRETDLPVIYREHPLLQDIRAARFTGKCGDCDYQDACGGSRARAFASSGSPLSEDPACAYTARMTV
ncbi:MAG: TIGR04053 family radical SAM/SPASM domain-containing protein [Bacilli bacterium]